MKTYYLTFTRTDHEGVVQNEYLEVRAPDILTASHMGDIYVQGYRRGGEIDGHLECSKVSLFPSGRPKS